MIELDQHRKEILILSARGLSDGEIARKLKVKIATIRYHMRRMKDHYQTESRPGILAAAIRAGDVKMEEIDGTLN